MHMVGSRMVYGKRSQVGPFFSEEPASEEKSDSTPFAPKTKCLFFVPLLCMEGGKGQLPVGEEMHCLLIGHSVQLLDCNKFLREVGWKSLETAVLCFLSLAQRKWVSGELLVWLCKVSFHYYPARNLQTQHFTCLFPESWGCGVAWGRGGFLQEKTHVGMSACTRPGFPFPSPGGPLTSLGILASVRDGNCDTEPRAAAFMFLTFLCRDGPFRNS